MWKKLVLIRKMFKVWLQERQRCIEVSNLKWKCYSKECLWRSHKIENYIQLQTYSFRMDEFNDVLFESSSACSKSLVHLLDSPVNISPVVDH